MYKKEKAKNDLPFRGQVFVFKNTQWCKLGDSCVRQLADMSPTKLEIFVGSIRE
jgi:hypothetical protein